MCESSLALIRRSFPTWEGNYKWSVAEANRFMPWRRTDTEKFATEGAAWVDTLDWASTPCCYDEHAVMLCRGWECSFRRNFFGVP